MDAARKSNRKYPAFTTEDLKRFVAEGRGTDEMVQEIMARDAGISRPFVTPQIGGGRPIVKVGRM
jgi:hypothetical protein